MDSGHGARVRAAVRAVRMVWRLYGAQSLKRGE
jgi:hypothetical protein